MTMQSILLLAAFLLVLLALSYPLGAYFAKVADHQPIRGLAWLHKFENLLYRLAGVETDAAPGWKTYALSLIAFNTLGALFVYAVQRLQFWLPLNPQGQVNVGTDSSFNTAISFVTNTNWQSYTPETTMSYLTQMLALTGQNFFSAATGIAVLFALIRGFTHRIVEDNRQFLGRSDPLDAVYPAAPVDRVRHLPDEPGRDAEFRQIQRRDSARPVTYTQPKNGADGQPLKDEKGNAITET